MQLPNLQAIAWWLVLALAIVQIATILFLRYRRWRKAKRGELPKLVRLSKAKGVKLCGFKSKQKLPKRRHGTLTLTNKFLKWETTELDRSGTWVIELPLSCIKGVATYKSLEIPKGVLPPKHLPGRYLHVQFELPGRELDKVVFQFKSDKDAEKFAKSINDAVRLHVKPSIREFLSEGEVLDFSQECLCSYFKPLSLNPVYGTLLLTNRRLRFITQDRVEFFSFMLESIRGVRLKDSGVELRVLVRGTEYLVGLRGLNAKEWVDRLTKLGISLSAGGSGE